MAIHFGYLAKIVDVETEYLYKDLEEETFMQCPKGMSDMGKDYWFILNKGIYVAVL